MRRMALTMEELKALNEQVRKILEERERTLSDLGRIERASAPEGKLPPKQSKLF